MTVFRTTFSIQPLEEKINHGDKILFMGSCFAENMGQKLVYYKQQVCLNPFGIIYNPFTIWQSLGFLVEKKEFTDIDLLLFGEKWISLKHHGDFSSKEKESCLQRINTSLEKGHLYLKKAKFLFITFGTSWVYRHIKTGEIAANCHKMPAKEFERFLLSPQEILSTYKELIARIRLINPNVKIVFTVSPVRHWKDGANGNQVSKSILHYAIHLIRQEVPGILYFPSYEICMDDLRDYRFYAKDMLHPSLVAMDYIWERFSEAYLSGATRSLLKRIDKINQALSHRPIDVLSASHQTFLQNILAKIKQITGEFPFLDFENEIQKIKGLMI